MNDQLPTPDMSKAMHEHVMKDQLRAGAKLILESQRGNTEVSGTDVDNLVQGFKDHLDVGVSGRKVFNTGLRLVGLAQSMDDEGFNPQPFFDQAHLIENGLGTVLRVQDQMQGLDTRVIPDEKIVTLKKALEAKMEGGKRALDTLGRGLQKMGLAEYIDDDDLNPGTTTVQ